MRTVSPNLITDAKRIVTFLFATLTLLLISNTSKAQEFEACGSAEHLHDELFSDPGLQSRIDFIEAAAKQNMTASNFRTAGTVITIPVVVHIVYNTTAENISDAQIQSQIDVLNEDFAKRNADTINIPGAFKPLASDAKIQFVLAKRDPSGNATSGITRTATSNTVFTTNSYVKYDVYGGKNAWNTTQYLNIWVCDLSGYGGYSTVPGASASVDGVVISYLCFGRTGTLMSTRNKGRTTTHEVGHWLGLAHTWGWSGTCGDDAIADTPTQEKQNTGVPIFPHVSTCSPNSNGDMFMNYMDYSNDVSRNMFTIAQTSKMNATIDTYRSGLLTSLGGVAPGTSTTSTQSCYVPMGLNTTLITSSSAKLNWSSTGAVGYNVRYKATSSSLWSNISTSLTSVSVSGLTGSTVYEFQVASVCTSGSSAFSGSSNFITAAPTTTSTPTTTTSTASGSVVTIGNSTMSEASNPYGTAFIKEHTQMIVTKSELVAAGYNSANNVIKSLAFFVNGASGQSMSNFTIKVKHISNTDFVSTSFVSTSGAVTVFASNFATTSGTWNTHNFATPFAYNGTDNLLIDITWSNSFSSSNSSVYASTTSGNKTLYYGATTKKTNISNVASGTLTSSRPNMKFGFSAASSARLANEENTESAIADAKMETSLFPNPTASKLNLSVTGVKEFSKMTISVYNIAGALVAEFDKTSDTSERQVISIDSNMQFSTLSSGVYIVTVESNDVTTSQKFILTK